MQICFNAYKNVQKQDGKVLQTFQRVTELSHGNCGYITFNVSSLRSCDNTIWKRFFPRLTQVKNYPQN